jgi:hypothetical protein
MVKLITICDKAEWICYLRKAAEFDCYHSWAFHAVDHSGEPFLFVYEDNGDFIAFPLIQRSIPGTIYYDLSCVYGFSGPFASKKMDEMSSAMMEGFKEAFLEFLSKGNYISVFVRMNPFFKQELLLDKFGGVYDNGIIVVLDLSLSYEEQRRNYSKSVKESINQARRKGFEVKQETGPKAIENFSSVYAETMQRVNATEYYRFTPDYFMALVNADAYDTRILTVYDGDNVMASTMIMLTNGIIQAHLVGTRKEYLQFSPTKLLVDYITVMGRELGMRYFNLGGGLGFKEGNLLDWKLSFTKNTMCFKSWRFIANRLVYRQLLDAQGIDESVDVDFFPLYRLVQPVMS